jgi:xanthine dehydrogenase small subunit
MSRTALRFLRRGRLVEVQNFDPKMTLLEWLRLDERSTGTKEGCAEGDCGACTVVLARERNGGLVYEPVNACIQLLGQIDGTEVITIEDLADGEKLHPVQEAMVKHHGSQCGYCTPGIVMSLFALHHAKLNDIDRTKINEALAGNLCRCTGYRPIVDAAMDACGDAPTDKFTRREADTIAKLMDIKADEDVLIGDEDQFFAAPANESTLSLLLANFPEATLIAGATDVGLWITKGLMNLKRIIYLGRVASLQTVVETKETITIGAAVSHMEAAPYLEKLDPDFAELVRRFASTQIRSSGTVVGNIANASPIGDWPPAFIALGATIELRQGLTSRTIPLEDFFIAYRRKDLRQGEYIASVTIQKPGPLDHVRLFKVSKRRDEDISSVMGAFRISVQNGQILQARIAFGGMAGVPQRALTTETAITGQSINDIATWRTGAEAMLNDYTPMSDHRASADYRMRVARNLVIKALAEIAGVPQSSTRVFPTEEMADVG